jgi:hypothetical protein
MAAPTITARTLPDRPKIKDGFKTTIAFSQAPALCFWEEGVKPPGVDGGDPIPQTTMHNTAWRTAAPRQLKTLTEITVTVRYNPRLYHDILTAINREDSITVHFPDLSSLAFYGYLKSFEANELKEGEPPTGTISIIPTNYDYTNGVEAAPVYSSPAGTAI